MSHIVLINPYFTGYVSIPTLGLGYLAGYLNKNSSHTSEVIEPLLEHLNREDVLARIGDADYVGLTCYTENRFQCFDFAEYIKESLPTVKIVIGGPHASIYPEKILERLPWIDYVIRLEGEQTLVELLDGCERSTIRGLTYRAEGKIISNENRPPMPRLTDTCFPYDDSMRFLEGWQDLETPKELRKVKHIPIMASRGCPYKCAFCGANSLGYRRWRGLPPELVVEQMERLNRVFDIQYFRFYDPLFYPDKKDINRFCQEIERRNLAIYFRIDIRVGTSEEILQRLYNAGCRVVGFGVESGSDEMLQFLNKKTSRKLIEETITICRKVGLWTIGFFMTSMPCETTDIREKTKPLYDRFDVFNLQFFMVQPGTSLYEQLKRQYSISDDIWFDRTCLDNIYYCQENFTDAAWDERSVKRTIRCEYYRFNFFHPLRVIKRRGLLQGLLTSSLSGILLALNRMPVVSGWYAALRMNDRYLWVKKMMNQRGIELYG